MAMTLQQMRDYIRLHLDLDEDDLPNTLVDIFIREGSKRVERAEVRWPFYEATYPLATAPGVADYDKTAISDELDQITALSNPTFGMLNWIGEQDYLDLLQRYPSTTSRPIYFSEWANTLSLFPTPNDVYNLTIRAYRKPNDWVAEGAGGTPDLPDELHNTVALWAMAKAYAQQEDPELQALYERQFSDELNEFRRRLNITPLSQPLVLNGGPLNRESGHYRSRRPLYSYAGGVF